MVDKPLANSICDDGREVVKKSPKKRSRLNNTHAQRYGPADRDCESLKDFYSAKDASVNPFASCVPDRYDEEERDAFSDDDMKLMCVADKSDLSSILAIAARACHNRDLLRPSGLDCQ